MAKTFVTRAQIMAIGRLLDAHLKPAEGGLFAYDDGWSDDKIAAEVATEANKANRGHVANIRQDVYGCLTDRSKPTADAQIAALETRVAALEKSLATLSALHERLCLKLSIDRVSDVRYLSGVPSPANPSGSVPQNGAKPATLPLGPRQ